MPEFTPRNFDNIAVETYMSEVSDAGGAESAWLQLGAILYQARERGVTHLTASDLGFPIPDFIEGLEIKFTRQAAYPNIKCACGMWTAPFALVDTTPLPELTAPETLPDGTANPYAGLTANPALACDGCWTRWIREGWLLPAGTDVPGFGVLTEPTPLTEALWVSLHGAPANIRDAFLSQAS